jgi:hypothetical protein
LYVTAEFAFLYRSNLPVTQKMMALFFAAIYFTALGYGFNWNLDKSPVELLNGFLEFEKVFFQGAVMQTLHELWIPSA